MPRRLAALAALSLLAPACRRAPPAAAPKFVAAAGALAAGTRLSDASLTAVVVPPGEAAGLVPLEELSGLEGRRTRIDLAPGDLLRPELLGGEELAPAAPQIQRKGRLYTLPLRGAEALRPGDHLDLLGYFTDPQSKEGMAMTLVQNVLVLSAGAPAPGAEPGTRPVGLLLLPEEGERCTLASHMGALHATLRNPEDVDIQEERGRATLVTLLVSERINTLLKKRLELQRTLFPAPADEPARDAPGRPTATAAPPLDPVPVGELAPTIEILDR